MNLRRSAPGILAVASLVALAVTGWLLLRETPDESLLRRWLAAQARGSVPASL